MKWKLGDGRLILSLGVTSACQDNSECKILFIPGMFLLHKLSYAIIMIDNIKNKIMNEKMIRTGEIVNLRLRQTDGCLSIRQVVTQCRYF